MRELEKTISKRIHEILIEKDWSPYTLSQKTDIASGYLTELLNLHPKRRWNTDLLGKVSIALGVPPWQLFINPAEVVPEGILALVEKYERLDGDNKRIVDAMLATAGHTETTQPRKRVVKKSAAT